MFRRLNTLGGRLARKHLSLQPFSLRCLSDKIQSQDLQIEMSQDLKQLEPKETLKFGASFTDHMLSIPWSESKGWQAPSIHPYRDLALSPAASSLHYALQCFEGMKAYIDKDDNIRLFRPDMNLKRFQNSSKRLFLPVPDEQELLAALKELLKIEKRWIPKGKGYSLYIRPTHISTHSFIGVAKAQASLVYVILSPVGPYYASGFAPVRLLAEPKYVRAWPGGTGDTKVGGNYAMGIKPGDEAINRGFAQMLWVFGDDLQVTEVGTMNIFFLWEKKDGSGKELVTAALDGTILPGVTRDSIIQLAKMWGDFEVSETHYTLHDVIDAVEEGRMVEAFGAGTAAIVSPVEGFQYKGKDYAIPLNPDKPEDMAGAFTKRIADNLMGIQYGEIEGPEGWSVVVK